MKVAGFDECSTWSLDVLQASEKPLGLSPDSSSYFSGILVYTSCMEQSPAFQHCLLVFEQSEQLSRTTCWGITCQPAAQNPAVPNSGLACTYRRCTERSWVQEDQTSDSQTQFKLQHDQCEWSSPHKTQRPHAAGRLSAKTGVTGPQVLPGPGNGLMMTGAQCSVSCHLDIHLFWVSGQCTS